MADNHHHHHHHSMPSHSGMEDQTDTSSFLSSSPATTAANILQTVMTTVMTSMDHHGHSAPETQHIGHHHMSSDQAASDLSESAHVHSSPLGLHGHAMQMYFTCDIDTVILFKDWRTTTVTGLIFSVIGIVILAMLYEGIKFFREYLFKKYFTSLEYSSVSVLGEDGKPVTEVHKVARNRMFSWPHLMQTSLHVVQMVLSYFLMLIFMTYNVWLCIGVIVGAGIGYFLFGWRKATVVDITEHCH